MNVKNKSVKINALFSLVVTKDDRCLLYIEMPIKFKSAAQKIADKVTALLNKDISVEIKQWREKRTITQNSYYWGLLNKLKDVLKTSEDELHILLLQRYGQIQADENGNAIIFSLRSDIPPIGALKYSKHIGSGNVNGVGFTHYKALKGSSEMNTNEMNVLIDGLISECKEVGIPTETPQELSLLKSEWGK